MNRASKDFAWTRKSGGSPHRALQGYARKGRALAEFLPVPAAAVLILLTILLVAVRATSKTHSPAVPLHSFQDAGHLSLDTANFNRLERVERKLDAMITDNRLKAGELPGVMKP